MGVPTTYDRDCRVEVSPLEGFSMSTDLAWCLPFEDLIGRVTLQRLLGFLQQTMANWFILP